MRLSGRILASVLASGLGLAVSAAHADTVGYNLQVTTEYLTGNPAGATFLGGGVPSPDTSYFVITNNGSTTFMGTIGDTAVSPGGDFSFSAPGTTVAPGQAVSIAIGPEGSNQGGYNGGSPQVGVIIQLVGNVTDGVSNEAVNLSVNDSDIHSGVPRTNPFGVTLDNYVLQGGDPFGRDTGDGYEETQAFGQFTFQESPNVVPLPTSAYCGLALLGLLGLGKLRARLVHAA